MREFPVAAMSRAMKLGSAFAGVVVVFVVAVMAVLPAFGDERWGAGVLAVVMVGVFAWATDMAPAAFRVDGRDLVVRGRLGRERRFAITGAASRLQGKLRGVRMAGSSGYLGYHGHWWIRGVGRCRVFASRRDGIVVVPTSQGPVLVSPADVDGFVAAVGP
jgi:hypothetical protein